MSNRIAQSIAGFLIVAGVLAAARATIYFDHTLVIVIAAIWADSIVRRTR